MKLSDLVSRYPTAMPAYGDPHQRVRLSVATFATAEPTYLGSSAAELIARTVGRVYGECSVRFSGTAFTGPQYDSGAAVLVYADSSWRVDSADGTWRKYAPSGITAIFGSGHVDTFYTVDDIEVSDAVAAEIVAAMNADDADRAERVVWRARPDQIVVRAIHAGDYQGGSVLLPDGTELDLCSSRAARLVMCEDAGVDPSSHGELNYALKTDTVPGRSRSYEESCRRTNERAIPLAMLDRLKELERAERAQWPDDPRSWREQENAATASARGCDLLGWTRVQFSEAAQNYIGSCYPNWQ